MHIWIDGDACPVPIKQILFRAAQRTGLHLTLVSNQPMTLPEAENIHYQRVEHGFDVADDSIMTQIQAGDLLISADIPLAAEAIEKEALVLDPRGTLLSERNIASRLQTRNILAQMRDSGQEIGGPPPLKAKDRQNFANQLDRLLQNYLRQRERE